MPTFTVHAQIRPRSEMDPDEVQDELTRHGLLDPAVVVYCDKEVGVVAQTNCGSREDACSAIRGGIRRVLDKFDEPHATYSTYVTPLLEDGLLPTAFPSPCSCAV